MATTIAEQLYEEGYAEGYEEGYAEGYVEGFVEGREPGREVGRQEGREGAREKAREVGRIAALRIMLVSRFGSQALDATCDARLQAATAAAIDRYLERVGIADSLAAVFEE